MNNNNQQYNLNYLCKKYKHLIKPKVSKKKTKQTLMKHRFTQHNSIIQLHLEKMKELENTNKLVGDLKKKIVILQENKKDLEHTYAICFLNSGNGHGHGTSHENNKHYMISPV